MTQTMELLIVYKDTPRNRLYTQLKKELKNVGVKYKEKINKNIAVSIRLSREKGYELLAKIGAFKECSYILCQYPNLYEWENETKIARQKDNIHNIFKKICKTTSPLIAFAGIVDYWPPFEDIMTKICQIKIPAQKNPNPRGSEPSEYPIYSEIGLFIGNEYIQAYQIEKDKLLSLKPQFTKGGLFIDIDKNGGIYITEPSKQEDKERYYAWEYLRRKFTEKE